MKLEPLGLKHETALFGIVSQSRNMKWIANGSTWSLAALRTKLALAESDWAVPDATKRGGYYWAIIDSDGTTKGFVGFHRPDTALPFTTRIVTQPVAAKSSISDIALRAALQKLANLDPNLRVVTAATLVSDNCGFAFYKNAGYRVVSTGKIGRRLVRYFVYVMPRAASAAPEAAAETAAAAAAPGARAGAGPEAADDPAKCACHRNANARECHSIRPGCPGEYDGPGAKWPEPGGPAAGTA
jgi:hypothetical protein